MSREEPNTDANPYSSPQVEFPPAIRPRADRSTELLLLGVLTSLVLLIAAISSPWASVWLFLMFVNLSVLRTWAWSRWEVMRGTPRTNRRCWQLLAKSLIAVALIILGTLTVFLVLYGILASSGAQFRLPDGSLAPPTDALAIAMFVLGVFLLNRSWPTSTATSTSLPKRSCEASSS